MMTSGDDDDVDPSLIFGGKFSVLAVNEPALGLVEAAGRLAINNDERVKHQRVGVFARGGGTRLGIRGV